MTPRTQPLCTSRSGGWLHRVALDMARIFDKSENWENLIITNSVSAGKAPDFAGQRDEPRQFGSDAIESGSGTRRVSDWVLMDQRRFDLFDSGNRRSGPYAHRQRRWCETNSPFGSTIAFGFLTISMLTELHHAGRAPRGGD